VKKGSGFKSHRRLFFYFFCVASYETLTVSVDMDESRDWGCARVVSEWCQSGVRVVSECCQIDVSVVSEWCQCGVTVWCYSVASEWCQSGVSE
jgi:hypothetical protein